MTFTNGIVRQAWQRAYGRCECLSAAHGHHGRCNKLLSWDRRGCEGWGGWEPHRKISVGPDTLANCEILCRDCHRATLG